MAGDVAAWDCKNADESDNSPCPDEETWHRSPRLFLIFRFDRDVKAAWTLPTFQIDPNCRIENKGLSAAGPWHVGCAFPIQDTCGMLKITFVEDQRRRRVIVEGKLIAPQAARPCQFKRRL